MLRHVLADETVAAGRALDESAVLVRQGDGEPIELRLDHVADRLVAEQPVDAFGELVEFLRSHRVGERHHLLAVGDLGELLAGCRSDALGRRVGRRQLRVCFFQLLQLAKEPVVFGIAQGGRVEYVVPVAGLAELLAQLVRAGGGIHAAWTYISLTDRRTLATFRAAPSRSCRCPAVRAECAPSRADESL